MNTIDKAYHALGEIEYNLIVEFNNAMAEKEIEVLMNDCYPLTLQVKIDTLGKAIADVKSALVKLRSL